MMAGIFDIELHDEDVLAQDSDDDTIEVEEVFISNMFTILTAWIFINCVIFLRINNEICY